MSSDATMTALVHYELAPGGCELRERPVPEIGPDDVLLRVAAVGICGSDVHQYHNTHSWTVNVPVVLGHEFCGEVERVGERVTGFAPGDRVVSETAARVDPASPFTRAGRYNLDPARRVVLKLRSRPEFGETETHYERTELTELLRDRPDNVVFSHEPMAQALANAEGLVTVSSTAAIEAMAMGVPVIALDTFGVSKTHLNTVFNGSGVQGSAEDVIARRFRHPNAQWLADNYFHAPEQSTWWSDVEQLVSLRRRGLLPPRFVPTARGGVLHEAWQRKAVLGRQPEPLEGAEVWVVPNPSGLNAHETVGTLAAAYAEAARAAGVI